MQNLNQYLNSKFCNLDEDNKIMLATIYNDILVAKLICNELFGQVTETGIFSIYDRIQYKKIALRATDAVD